MTFSMIFLEDGGIKSLSISIYFVNNFSLFRRGSIGHISVDKTYKTPGFMELGSHHSHLLRYKKEE